MTLHAKDEVVASRHIRIEGSGGTVRIGTPGIVLKRLEKRTPTYRVQFRLPGFPGRSASVDNLTEKDIARSETSPDLLHGRQRVIRPNSSSPGG